MVKVVAVIGELTQGDVYSPVTGFVLAHDSLVPEDGRTALTACVIDGTITATAATLQVILSLVLRGSALVEDGTYKSWMQKTYINSRFHQNEYYLS